MPNYSYQSNAIFEPMTFEQYIRPALMYGEAYKDVADLYDALSTQSNTFMERAKAEKDLQWAQRYMKYAEGLREAADKLATDGLSLDIRSRLRSYKRDYGTVIDPISKAIEQLKSWQEEQRKLNASTGNRMAFSKMPSIDEIIGNPEATYQAVNGKTLYDMAMNEAAAASKRNIEQIDPQNVAIRGLLKYGKKLGFTNEDIAQLFLPGTYLNNIYNNVLQSQDLSSLSLADQQRMQREIVNGILAGATLDEDYKYVEDPYQNYLWLASLAKMRSSNSGKSSGSDKTVYRDTEQIFGDMTREAVSKFLDKDGNIKRNIRKIYFDKDGKFKSKSDGSPYGTMFGLSPYDIGYDINPNGKNTNPITEALGNIGYSEDDLEGKSYEEINQLLKNINNGNFNDVQGREMYRFVNNEATTKLLISRVAGRKLNTIKGMRDGEFRKGKSKEIEYNKDITSSKLRIDPGTGMLLLEYDGTQYEYPLSELPVEARDALDLMTQNNTIYNNLIKNRDKLTEDQIQNLFMYESPESVAARDYNYGQIANTLFVTRGTQNLTPNYIE